MTRRDHGYAIGALRAGFGIDRLPHAIGWRDDGDAWIIDLEGDRTMVLSKSEYPRIGRIEYREPVAFGLIGGFHFVSGSDPYESFRESWDEDALGDAGKIHQRSRSARGGRS